MNRNLKSAIATRSVMAMGVLAGAITCSATAYAQRPEADPAFVSTRTREADWAVRGCARPNAHVHIRAIAMFCLALAGRGREAGTLALAIQREQRGYGVEDFLRAFKLGDDAQALVRQAAGRIPP